MPKFFISKLTWETDFYTMLVLNFFQNLLQIFQPLRQTVAVVYKIPSPMGPDILYTTGSEKRVKVSMAILPSSGGGV